MKPQSTSTSRSTSSAPSRRVLGPIAFGLMVAVQTVDAAGVVVQGLAHEGSEIVLDGERVSVFWDDGDTFKLKGDNKGVRLVGYNTLESYGAVHKFGPGPKVLYGVAKRATELARSKAWVCVRKPGDGGYGRLVVDCPGLKTAMLEQGLAHAFSVDGPAPKADLRSQGVGIRAARGMWAQGAPATVVTSAHSRDEKPDQKQTYNRVLTVKTGHAVKRMHGQIYAACSWACVEDSCLLYVPYARRYGEKKAECLKDVE